MTNQLSKTFELTLNQQDSKELCLVNIIENSNRVKQQVTCLVYSEDLLIGTAKLYARKAASDNSTIKLEVNCINLNLAEILSDSLHQPYVFKMITDGTEDPTLVGIKFVFTNRKGLPLVDFYLETHQFPPVAVMDKLTDRYKTLPGVEEKHDQRDMVERIDRLEAEINHLKQLIESIKPIDNGRVYGPFNPVKQPPFFSPQPGTWGLHNDPYIHPFNQQTPSAIFSSSGLTADQIPSSIAVAVQNVTVVCIKLRDRYLRCVEGITTKSPISIDIAPLAETHWFESHYGKIYVHHKVHMLVNSCGTLESNLLQKNITEVPTLLDILDMIFSVFTGRQDNVVKTLSANMLTKQTEKL